MFFNLIDVLPFCATPRLPGNFSKYFLPWLKKELEKKGYSVSIPDLPHSENPSEKEQVDFVLHNEKFHTQTILFGHSLGAVIAMKVAEKLETKIAGLVLAGGFTEAKFKDKERPFKKAFDWHFDFAKIVKNAGFRKILQDHNDYAIPQEQAELLQQKLQAELFTVTAEKPHFMNTEEPAILQHILP